MSREKKYVSWVFKNNKISTRLAQSIHKIGTKLPKIPDFDKNLLVLRKKKVRIFGSCFVVKIRTTRFCAKLSSTPPRPPRFGQDGKKRRVYERPLEFDHASNRRRAGCACASACASASARGGRRQQAPAPALEPLASLTAFEEFEAVSVSSLRPKPPPAFEEFEAVSVSSLSESQFLLLLLLLR